MPSKNTTRNAPRSNEDDFPSIVVPSSKNSTPKSKKKSPRAAFQEPIPVSPTPPKPWEILRISEEEYKIQQIRKAELMAEYKRQAIHDAYESMWNSLSYWEGRLRTLEMLRERYNRMGAWSADTLAAVEDLDTLMEECEAEIEDIWNYEEEKAMMYDS